MVKSDNGLRQSAYDYLLDMILSKRIMPGEKIPELKLAQDFGISRTPIRDAMRQLANDGLIEIFPNRFAQVRVYDDRAIRDIGILRIALDTMAIKLAAMFGSKADYLRLKRIALDCSEASSEGASTLRRRYDSDFHMELARMSGNELLVKFQKELYVRLQFVILHHPNPMEVEIRHLRQHIEIADALMERDEKTALAAILDHLTTFYNLGDTFPKEFFAVSPYMLNTARGGT